MHKYIILGPQGCGKGTQAKRLQQDLDLVHISVGDIFRWHIQNHTKLGTRARQRVSAGQLVSDEVVQEVVKWRLDLHDWNYGFVLDGFPRNVSQAEFFLQHYDFDAVIQIEVPDDVVMERILGRRLCSGCHQDYNLSFRPPTVPNVCDACGAALIARADDNPDAIRDRLRDYHTKTEPTLELFAKRGPIVRADGRQSSDEVYAVIRRGLGLAEPKGL